MDMIVTGMFVSLLQNTAILSVLITLGALILCFVVIAIYFCIRLRNSKIDKGDPEWIVSITMTYVITIEDSDEHNTKDGLKIGMTTCYGRIVYVLELAQEWTKKKRILTIDHLHLDSN